MATLKSLADRLFRVADSLDTELKAAKTEVATTLVRELVQRTPVDTSRALSNWQATTGTALGRIDPHVMGKGGSTQEASAAIAIAQATAAIRAAAPEQVLAIFNALPYIQRLNEGYSDQAPAGFVEAAVMVARAVLRARK